MEERNVYQDISRRTDGDVYIGVVGPVRTGKSTYAYWRLTGKICLCLLSVQQIMSILFRRQTAPVPKFSVQGQQV